MVAIAQKELDDSSNPAKSSQASDSGDQLTIWVTTSAEARHISVNYLDRIYRALEEMDRVNVTVRFVATGYEDDEDEEAG